MIEKRRVCLYLKNIGATLEKEKAATGLLVPPPLIGYQKIFYLSFCTCLHLLKSTNKFQTGNLNQSANTKQENEWDPFPA